MFKYTIVIEKANGNYSAYCPDLPGCVAMGASIEETTERIKESIEFHIEGLKAEGFDVPPPATTAALVEIAIQRIDKSESTDYHRHSDALFFCHSERSAAIPEIASPGFARLAATVRSIILAPTFGVEESFILAPILSTVEGVTHSKMSIVYFNIPLRLRGIKGVTSIK